MRAQADVPSARRTDPAGDVPDRANKSGARATRLSTRHVEELVAGQERLGRLPLGRPVRLLVLARADVVLPVNRGRKRLLCYRMADQNSVTPAKDVWRPNGNESGDPLAFRGGGW
jgi:hypothetical protein